MAQALSTSGKSEPTEEQVRLLVTAQCPQWADLQLIKIVTAGTEHNLWRLGDHLTLRLPRNSDAEHGALTEARWLTSLAGQIPLRVPRVRWVGEPGPSFPFAWTASEWINGDDLGDVVLQGQVPASWADQLTDTIAALRAYDLSGVADKHLPRGSRGGTIAPRTDDLLVA